MKIILSIDGKSIGVKKRKAFLFTLFLLFVFPLSVLGGMISDEIKNFCPEQYYAHQEIVHEYSVRIQDYVKKFGCEIIDIYAVFAEENIQIIELLEDDESLMEVVVDLFANVPALIPVFQKNPKILSSILFTAQADETAFINLKEMFMAMSRYELRKMERDPRYFLYVIAANMMNSGEKDVCDVRKLMTQLRKKISVNDIETFMFLMNVSYRLYSDISVDKRMKYVDLVLTTVGKKTLQKLQRYQQYLIYFLPPDISEIAESQELSPVKLEHLQHDYIDVMAYVFRCYADGEFHSCEFGLLMVEMLSEYVQDALRYYQNSDEIKEYLDFQFRSAVFPYGNQYCNIEYRKKLKEFFRMYAPVNSNNGQPLLGTEGNLGLIAKWFTHGSGRQFVKSAQPGDWNHFSQSMCFLPEIYFNLSDTQVEVFDDLLMNLPANPVTNGLFLILLSQRSKYYEWVDADKGDAFYVIRHNPDDTYGRTARKYKYIFLTSFPKDEDLSLFLKFSNGKQILMSDIYSLMDMNDKELYKHNFTDFERYCETFDKVQVAIDITCILAIPLTGGASIGITAAKAAARKGVKKAAKKALKELARRSAKSVSRLVKIATKEGRKIAMRELRELTGMAVKRGRKTVQHTMQRGLYRVGAVNDSVQLTCFAYGIAATYFLSQSIVDSGMSGICPELTGQE